MNKYNGNGKPFVYVWFPPEEKDRAVAILEKFVEKNGNISFWWADKPLKKPDNIIRAAFSVIAFVKQSSLSDKHFRKVIDTAVRNEKKILPVHLEEMEYKTPWSRLALGSKQGIIRAAYKSDDQLIEKMTGAETFVNMKVTAGLFLTGVIGFDPGDSEQTVEIGDFSISGTQAELDKITTLCIYGDREPTTDYVYNYIGFRDTNDNYSNEILQYKIQKVLSHI